MAKKQYLKVWTVTQEDKATTQTNSIPRTFIQEVKISIRHAENLDPQLNSWTKLKMELPSLPSPSLSNCSKVRARGVGWQCRLASSTRSKFQHFSTYMLDSFFHAPPLHRINSFCATQSLSRYTFGRMAASNAMCSYARTPSLVWRGAETYPERLKNCSHPTSTGT